MNRYCQKDTNFQWFLAIRKLIIIGVTLLIPFNLMAENDVTDTSNKVASTSTSTGASAESQNRTIGRVVKFVRNAVLVDKTNEQSVRIKRRGERFFAGNELHTGSNSKAYIKMADGSKILLRQNSKLRMSNRRNVAVDRGKIMFSVAKRNPRQRPFQVATRIAMLGIRGTQFVVEAGENDQDFNVYLKEGDITVYPVEKQFKLYKEKQEQDFADFLNAQRSEFEAMKDERAKQFAEYVEEITMNKNKGLSFSGNEVKEVEIPDEVKAWFDEFDDPDIDW